MNKKTEKEISDYRIAVEKQYRLFDIHIDQVSLWRLLRFEVNYAYADLSFPRKPLSRFQLLRSLIVFSAQMLFKPRRQLRYLCKSFDSSHRLLEDGAYRDIYVDSLLEYCSDGMKMSSCDAPGYGPKITNAFHSPDYDDTGIIMLSAILGRLFPVQKNHSAYKTLSDLIRTHFGLAQYTPHKICQTYSVFVWRSRLYGLLLKKLKPSCIVCADSGQFALVHAARQQGIVFFEIQHGVFTREHSNALSSEVPYSHDLDYLLPDRYGVFGPYFEKHLHGTCLEQNKSIVSVGSSMSERYKTMRDRYFSPNKDHPVITLTTQGLDSERLKHWLAHLCDSVQTPFTLNIALHPAYHTDEAIFMSLTKRDDRIRLYNHSSQETAYDLIALSDAHMSISSACHFDALGMGTPTAILALETHEMMHDLVAQHYASQLDDCDRLVEWIVNREWEQADKIDRNIFFKSGFEQNMNRLMPG